MADFEEAIERSCNAPKEGIESELALLDNAVECVRNQIGALTSKLGPVLLPELEFLSASGVGGGPSIAPERVKSSMANELSELNSRISATARSISALTSRIDI